MIKKQLDPVTRFSQDIGMNFGQDKCAHLVIEKGQIKNNVYLEMNGVKIQQVDEGECYKYLGQDENISYAGTVNKERVSKEYFTRVRKTWKPKFLTFNNTIAHNMFAVPVLKPTTYGILDWTIQKIRNTVIKTRNVLSITGNFHINSNVDFLYIPRSEGGRVLKAIETACECGIVSFNHHLTRNKDRN